MQVTLQGIPIEYVQEGAGPDLVLLHGWGYDMTLLDNLAKALSASFRVLRLDFPGHGKSGVPENPIGAEDFAKIVSGLCAHLGIASANFIGHSNGGRTLLALSAENPSLIKKAILCGGAGLLKKRTLAYYVKVYGYKAGKAFLSLPVFPKSWLARFQQNKGSEDYRKLSGVMRATFSNLVNKDWRFALPGIKFPVLLVWGDKDGETPLWMAKEMEKAIPDCGLVVYPNAGHYAFLERMPAFVRVVNVFFGGLNA